jgi:YrbI family 3-deoxy-D-manno-octulosonate 8-phosphate phosphatase
MATDFEAKWIIFGDGILWRSEDTLALPRDEYRIGDFIFLCGEKQPTLPIQTIPFSTYDGFAIKNILANILNIPSAIIVQSPDHPEIIQRRCLDLNIPFYFRGIRDKPQFMAQFCRDRRCTLGDVIIFDRHLTPADFPGEQPGLLLPNHHFPDQHHLIRAFTDDYGGRNPKVLAYYDEMRTHWADCPESIRSERKKIRALICDIDGTCTDGFKIYGKGDSEWKRFSNADIRAISDWNASGNLGFLITGESGAIPQKFAQHCQIPPENVFTNAGSQKVSILHKICMQRHLQLGEIAYIGDDMNDWGIIGHLITENGIAACPANAVPLIKNIPKIVPLKTRGGQGAVAEWITVIRNVC